MQLYLMNNCNKNNETTNFLTFKWKTPLYLFSGVGAVLLRIYFASLVLAYSCWKLEHGNNKELGDPIEHSTQSYRAINSKEESKRVVEMKHVDDIPHS